MAPAIVATGLGKEYRIGAARQDEPTLRETVTRALREPGPFARGLVGAETAPRFWALRDVGFEVEAGEAVGIIGRNGAGKSTLLKVLSRITRPTTGTARLRGRVGSLLEVGTGFHPELTGRENVFLSGVILGMARRDVARRLDEIVDFAGIGPFLDTPIKRYSSGMYLRLAFAVAAHLEPEILIVDEVLAVGDAEFQKRCLGKMERVAHEGRTVLFVSHNMDAVRNLCRRCFLLDGGRLATTGSPAEVIHRYLGGDDGREGERALGLTSQVIDLDRVRLRRVDGAVARTFPFAEGLSIEIDYRVKGQLSGLAIGVVVWTEEGQAVFTSSSWVATGARGLPLGAGVARARVPGWFLAPGGYTLFVDAHTHSDALVSEPLALSFQVLDQGREALGREGMMRWPGVVSPKLEWDLGA